MDCLPVLLDPATKAFRSWLLEDNELLQVTTSLLKAKHLKAYEALNSKSNNQDVVDLENLPSDNEEEKGGDSNNSNQDSRDKEDEDGDSEGHGIVLDEESVSSNSGDLTEEANAVFEKWMKFTPKFGDYLFDRAEPLKTSKKSGKVTFKELVSKFDTMKYHRESCSVDFPSINLLARVHFLTMLNARFQERVFSTCSFVQGINQGRMGISHMEMKALLMQNADLIRKGVI